jgi:dUTP pyrophosphatase
VNSPGLVDAGYRGELRVLLLNTDRERAFEIATGDRIAQMLITPITAPQFVEALALAETARGERGFGSTGV